MEGLLTLFVGLTAIAIVIQAGILIAIYIVSKRVADQVEGLIRETRPLIVPMKSITENLKVASADLIEIGGSAKVQFGRIEEMLTDTREALQVQLERFDRASQKILEEVNQTVGLVENSVIRPVTQISSFAKGVSRGLEVLLSFSRRSRDTTQRSREAKEEDMFI